MFFLKQLSHTINLHPQYFGPQIRAYLTRRLYEEVEGTCSGQYGYIISVVDIVEVGKGVLQTNTGFAQFQIQYKAIVFKPFRNQVVDGIVATVNKLIPSYLKFDPNSNPPAYIGDGQEIGEASVRIEKGEKVRLRIVGTRVDATEIDDNDNNGTFPGFLKSDSLDGSLAEAINAIEPNTVPVPAAPAARGAPVAGRRARPQQQGGPDIQLSVTTDGAGSQGNLTKADSSSHDNVTMLLNRADSLQTQLNIQEPKSPLAARKSPFKASFKGMLPKFSLSGMLRQDGAGRKGETEDASDALSPTDALSPSGSALSPSAAGTPASATAAGGSAGGSPAPGGQGGSTPGESFAKRGRRISRGAAFALNDDIDDEKVKKTTTVSGPVAQTAPTVTSTGDGITAVIPDLMDVEDEDMSAMVAAAPAARSKTMKTIGELESDIAQGDGIASHLQHLSVPGLDLSLLINAALCPPQQLEEPDQPWDWDVIFTQVSSEMQASGDVGPLLSPELMQARAGIAVV
nr:DNA-directed RNA polymerase II subunit [Polyrhizophydium stewartii]